MEPAALLEELRAAIRDIIRGEMRVATAYSGGVDSSVISALAAEVTETRCYSAVVPESHDARTVVGSAQGEGRSLEVISLSDPDLKRLAAKAVSLVGNASLMSVSYTVPLVAVIERADEHLILAGNGADEIFGGYAKYVNSVDACSQMLADLEKVLGEASALRGYSAGLGKTIEFPFLYPGMLQFAAKLPLEQKLHETARKIILREAAKELGLPSHDRPKKAAQYSSGVMRRLEKLAKSENMPADEWLRGL